MKLAEEIWALSPPLRQRYGNNWSTFWDTQARPIEHVITGDYDKLKDLQLHDGFKAFLQKNFPETLDRIGASKVLKISQVVGPLAAFLDKRSGERIGRASDFSSSAPLEVMTFQPDEPENQSTIAVCLAWRKPVPESGWFGAVWFSPNSATHRYEGFLLRRQRVVILRDVGDEDRFLLLMLERSHDRESVEYRCIVYRRDYSWRGLVGKLVRNRDVEAHAVAAAFLNSLDNIDIPSNP